MSSERYHQHFTVSWDQIHRDVRQLCHLLIERDFKGIVAITRGGLIPAALIARELNIRLIDTICIKSYDHMNQGGLDIMKGVDHDGRRVFFHTEVGEEFSGHGLAGIVVEEAVRATREEGLTVVPVCPYVKKWLTKHTDHGATVAQPTPDDLAAIPQ